MKRGQFFLATTIMVMLTVSLIALHLYIPPELNSLEAENTNNFLNRLSSARQLIGEVGDYARVRWLLPFTNRIKIRVENDFKMTDKTLSISIDLPANAYRSSLVMRDYKGRKVPFNVEWLNKTKGVVYFDASAPALGRKDYFIYYNTAPGKVLNEEKSQLVNYSLNNGVLIIRASSYSAMINTSKGGEFYLNYSDKKLLSSFNSFIKCGQTMWINESNNMDFSVINKKYYVKVIFTGSSFENETHTITELFFPDRVLIKTKLRLASDSHCSNWGTSVEFNKTMLMNYYDSLGNTYEPVPVAGKTYNGENKWSEHYGDFSMGLVPGNTSPHYYFSDSSKVTGEYDFINNTSLIGKGTYINNLTIIPSIYRLNRTMKHKKPAATIYYENMSTLTTELFDIVKDYLEDNNIILIHSEEPALAHESFCNQSNWLDGYERRDSFLLSSPFMTPIEAGILLNQNDADSLTLAAEGKLPTQISTDNYHLSSSFDNFFNNSIIDNRFFMFNPNAEDFNVTIVKTSGTLNASLSYPDGRIYYYNINASPYRINVITNKSGFYNMTFNGSAAFAINTSLPKIVSSLPSELMNGSPVYLFVNESVKNISLTIRTLSSNNQRFSLFDEFNNSIASVSRQSAGASEISAEVVPCIRGCIYRLDIDNDGPFIINSSLGYISSDKKFIINPKEPLLTLITTSTINPPENIFAYYNTTVSGRRTAGSDLNYSETLKYVQNSFYKFDFNNNMLTYNGTNWGKWLTCTTSCSDSFNNVRFIEKGSERVVVNASSNGVNYLFFFYPNLSLFKVRTYFNTYYRFGPQWKTNGTNDKYASFKSSELISFNGSPVIINRYNLTGPVAYVSKSDDFSSASVILNTNSLAMNNSIRLNETSILINGFGNGEFSFLMDTSPVDYLKPVIIKQELLKIYYNYSSNNAKITGSMP